VAQTVKRTNVTNLMTADVLCGRVTLHIPKETFDDVMGLASAHIKLSRQEALDLARVLTNQAERLNKTRKPRKKRK
jgi:hypothetical protein